MPIPLPLRTLSVRPTPSSSASPDSGRGARRAGRITPRGYPKSARVESNIGSGKSWLRLDLLCLQRGVHHAVEDRPGDGHAEIVVVGLGVLHVDGDDELRAVTRCHANV